MNGTGPGRAGTAARALSTVLARRRGTARRLRRLCGAVAAVGLALPLTGCGVFGSGLTITAPAAMTISSGAFTGLIMPSRYTCDNPKASNPPLGWGGAPAGTKSFALVVDDADAPITPYVYWVVFDINPAASDILEGQLPPGAHVAQNSAGRAVYAPPCPGPGGHQYRITIYALNTWLQLPSGTSLYSAWTKIAEATIGRGRIPVTATSGPRTASEVS